MTTTKRTIADSISRRTGLSKVRSIEVLETLLKIIKQTLQDGDKVLISGFGKFYVKEKSPRMVRDPNTGEPLPLEARRVVLFSYSQR
ncbi:MAG: HU family DNA-binding protein [Deltaproteobacteria bacterium]|nr:HU family DNA-binding protein [Deltaproteobacteria bacterium]